MAAVSQFLQLHSTKKYRLMTEKSDAAGNKYVYLKGVASLAAGDFVSYDGLGVSTRTVAASTGAIAVSMVANTAITTFSWFMIEGRHATANVATHSSGIGKALCTTATPGRLSSTQVTETVVYGAFSDANSASNVGPVFLRRPVAPGDIST